VFPRIDSGKGGEIGKSKIQTTGHTYNAQQKSRFTPSDFCLSAKMGDSPRKHPLPQSPTKLTEVAFVGSVSGKNIHMEITTLAIGKETAIPAFGPDLLGAQGF
jgi:hypothetical protein